ncbi:MAG TPA: hypothetical protein VKA15_01350 [Isosphaeraceae bacterium]|nr:hypothetical protein [Isosphaeraceae bacterium]
MRESRHDRQPVSLPTTTQRGIWWSRGCLIGGIIVYLGLAVLAARWWPHEPFIASIWIFLSAHSAAYLLVHEIRGYEDESS